MENTKKCSKCCRELPLESFSKYKRSKDGLFCWCKECHKQYRAEHAEERAAYDKQYRAEHSDERAAYDKQYRAEHSDERAAYNKQYRAEYYATIEGYAYYVRWHNLYADRKRGRIAKDEDPLPPLSYHIEKFSEGIDYYDGKKYPFNELGFDRIDDSKPHTIDNVVVATTFHNKDRWNKRMTVEEYRKYIQKENEELAIACESL